MINCWSWRTQWKVSWRRSTSSILICKRSKVTSGSSKDGIRNILLISSCKSSDGMMPSIQETILFLDWQKLLKWSWTTLKMSWDRKPIPIMRWEYNSVKAHKKSKISILCRGNYYVKDLTDVLVEPHVSPSDFKYTKYMTTLVCIVPTGNEEDFKMNSDFITDYVVP